METIQKKNLNDMADYFEAGSLVAPFRMNQYCHCVLGHSVRVLEKKTGFWNFQWIQGAAERLFGFKESSAEGMFCLSATWHNMNEVDDPKAAAARLRYVARHEAAPSADQWPRFREVPRVVEAEEEVLEEVFA